jgi:hypothetical protein
MAWSNILVALIHVTFACVGVVLATFVDLTSLFSGNLSVSSVVDLSAYALWFACYFGAFLYSIWPVRFGGRPTPTTAAKFAKSLVPAVPLVAMVAIVYIRGPSYA